MISEKGSLLYAAHTWAQGIQRLETELRGTKESPSPRGEPESTLPWEECLWNTNGGLQTKLEAAES